MEKKPNPNKMTNFKIYPKLTQDTETILKNITICSNQIIQKREEMTEIRAFAFSLAGAT